MALGSSEGDRAAQEARWISAAVSLADHFHGATGRNMRTIGRAVQHPGSCRNEQESLSQRRQAPGTA
jgi:hypothetical protein